MSTGPPRATRLRRDVGCGSESDRVGEGDSDVSGGKPTGTFRFLDVFLAVFCIVFSVEAAAPAAAIGNSQFFWWLLLTFTFLLPYGLVAAELGTTYQSSGGIYDWVRLAFGDRWGAREAWYYWANFPIWVASMAVLFPSTIQGITGLSLGVFERVAIELAFIWMISAVGDRKVSESGWILNAVAFLKVGIALVVGITGLWFAWNRGLANPFTFSSFLPDFSNTRALAYLPTILFNFLGFEVVASFVDSMRNPEKDMPVALILGGLTVASIYIFISFGIGAAIPVDEISPDTGVADAIAIMLGQGSILYPIVSVAFLLTFVGGGIAWAFGVNSVAIQAAEEGNLPSWFAARGRRTGMNVGVSVVNGVISSVLVILQETLPDAGANVFWALFSMQLVVLMLSYVPMFPALLRLRRIDPGTRRPFMCPGGPVALRVVSLLPAIEAAVAIVVNVVPFDGSEAEMDKLSVLATVVVFVIVGEVVGAVLARRRSRGRGLSDRS